ncbi:hypothetical protein [Hymenobacter pini]|uniref:hypothetical protein n=1 Tax=Hymenobacter pini TaxID=2880879 RepID=UPI001CF11EA3|nr:hypothetical protein [Hymenobacter pini]MCA8831931.1 hypothetical protein [Hymenobacter pini]
MAKKNATAPITTPAVLETAPAEARRAYLLEKVDEATGEVQQVSRFRYLPGHPRQIRFDAKAGQFNINGVTPLGNALRFIPLAWRIFQDDILNMGRKLWAELFYADEKGAICAVLFHGYSVENLYRLIEPLFYDDLTLADVVVKVQASKKETTKDGKKATYYIAEFSYEPADPAEVQARREFAQDFTIWREETHTGTADVRIQHGYQRPQAEAAPLELPAGEASATAQAA